MPEKLRCFISLDLPKDAVLKLKEVEDEIWKQDMFIGKITEEEHIHLTLKFLGSISKDKVETVRRRLKNISFDKFEASIDEIGVFSEEFVRIIWVALNGEEVMRLQSMIDNCLEDQFPKEERFMSHITLARVKNVKAKVELLKYISKFSLKEIKANIESFSLMTSELRPEGPKYSLIERYELN